MVCLQYIWVGSSGGILPLPCAQKTQVFSDLVVSVQTWWPPCHGPSEVDTAYYRPHVCSALLTSACLPTNLGLPTPQGIVSWYSLDMDFVDSRPVPAVVS